MKVFKAFTKNQSISGAILLICTIIAVIFASVPGCEWFDAFWEKPASISVGDRSISMSIRTWINDALMAVFFFVVGLEIKREMLVGHLASPKQAVLPIMAAVGGMIVPALIYLAFNFDNPETMKGWGVPMATDIAFAIGIISILGRRVPICLKVFLTALAIVDDLGAIIVLAIFYPAHDLHLHYFIQVGIIMLVLLLFNKIRVRNSLLYVIPGILMWYFTYKSGVHATIAGVLLAMVIPSRGTVNEARFQSRMELLVRKFKTLSQHDIRVLASPEEQQVIHEMTNEVKRVDPLMHQLESRLHQVVNYIIIPIFALANAGVALNFDSFSNGIPTVTLGISLGLLVGKPLGIFLFSYLSIKSKVAEMPFGAKWKQLFAVSILGGIGFTMSLFVNGLAFNDPINTDIGKISILMTSITAAATGLIALYATCPKRGCRKI